MVIAKMPWQPTSISLTQSKQALALALKSAGGYGVPCTASVPFLAIPGLVLSTVKGTIYPIDYAIAVETTRPPVQNRTVISAVTNFANVQGSSVPIEIAGFALSQNRRAGACTDGTEWRYRWLDQADYVVCSCAANTVCKDETVCVGAPSSGNRWAVAAVPSGLCTIPKEVTSSSDQSLALGLGLGLGLGLPLTAAIGYAAMLMSQRKKAPVEEERNIQSVQIVFENQPSEAPEAPKNQ